MIKGMLDISILNVDKALTTPEKISDFLDKEMEIQEKVDGTKLTIVRNNNDFDPKDVMNNFIFAYKRTILYPEDYEGVDRVQAFKGSIGDAQYAFVLDHFDGINNKLKDIPKNTEFFIEYMMNKPTLTRDYKVKHRMMLIGYAPTKYTEKAGLLTTQPGEMENEKVPEYANMMSIDRPRVIVDGKIFPLKALKPSIDDSEFQKLIDANEKKLQTTDKQLYYETFKQLLLDLESRYGGKTEGVVIAFPEGDLLKILQSDQHDKEVRASRKEKYTMEPEKEASYFLEMKKISEDILKDIDVKKPFREIIKELSKLAYNKTKEELPEHSKKSLIQMQEDLFHNIKYLLVKKLPGNNAALFIGRMQPPTKLHFAIIREGLKNFDNVVVAIVKGKKSEAKDNPFSFETQKEIINTVFPDVKIIQVGTGNIISAMNASDENINAVLCGTDRLESYRNQLKTNPEIAVVETARDPDGVSGTKLRKALLDGNKTEFERNSDPKAYKFYDKLRKEIKGETSERFMNFEDFSHLYENFVTLSL
jgi:nicotinamide mononucleotide adenylyltransferase